MHILIQRLALSVKRSRVCRKSALRRAVGNNIANRVIAMRRLFIAYTSFCAIWTCARGARQAHAMHIDAWGGRAARVARRPPTPLLSQLS